MVGLHRGTENRPNITSEHWVAHLTWLNLHVHPLLPDSNTIRSDKDKSKMHTSKAVSTLLTITAALFKKYAF